MLTRVDYKGPSVDVWPGGTAWASFEGEFDLSDARIDCIDWSFYLVP